MAYSGNQQLPGLWPVASPAGTAPKITHYVVDSAYATTIGEGCIVCKKADGIELVPDSGMTLGNVVGVAAANLAATTGGTIPVFDDPNQQFVVITDGTISGTVALEMVGQFVEVVSNVYNATLTQGKAIADISTVSGTLNTTDLSVQVVGPGDSGNVGEAQSSAYSQILVKIPAAAHMYASQSGTNVNPAT